MIIKSRLFGSKNQMTEEVLYNNILIERQELHEIKNKMKQYEKDVSELLNELNSIKQEKKPQKVADVKYDESSEEDLYVRITQFDFLQRDIADLRKKMVRYDQVEDLDNQVRELNEKLQHIERIGEIRKDVDKLQIRMRELQERVEDGFSKDMVELFREMQEKNHEDCIKVYRNVQAVIIEETAKQNKVIVDIAKNNSKMKEKVSWIFIFSLVSLIVSVCLALLQILPSFGIDLFGI